MRIGFIGVIFFAIYSMSGHAATGEINDQALDDIRAFAEGFCGDYFNEGSESKLELSGNAEARIANLLSKLVNLGIEGSVDFKTSEYMGLLRDQLGPELMDNRDCRLTIWQDLENRLITPKKEATTEQILETIDWYRSRCGDNLQLVVPYGAGGKSDVAMRSFFSAFTRSGTRLSGIVRNMPGAFNDTGEYSIDKIDRWHRAQTTKEGCLLTVVHQVYSERFQKPHFNLKLKDRWYSIVLPRGILTEISQRWGIMLHKVVSDPDFLYEIREINYISEWDFIPMTE